MSVVYGADGVDYVGGRQGVRGGYLGVAGGAAIQSEAFAEEGWAGSGVDGAVLDMMDELVSWISSNSAKAVGRHLRSDDGYTYDAASTQ